jgi:hypothetical protein
VEGRERAFVIDQDETRFRAAAIDAEEDGHGVT